ncbi:MAG TPA: response regulator transcription factor [Candidatus Acidoferrum sp.]|jgi:DNA-binding NarL/FixJ family response regulator|nr:response regulator transcription factor [Candidatus Acidoferrum sp.]
MAKPRAAKTRRRIFVVDDHPLTRHGITQLIGQQRDLVICGEAGDAEHALDGVRTLRPELVLVDVTLPGKPGLEFIKDLTAMYPEILVLVVSMHDERLYAERALRAGARGYLMKSAGGDELVKAIRQVFAGEVYVSHELSARILDNLTGRPQRPGVLGALSDREFAVFQLVGEGLTTREIGLRLHISGKTVETHRLHIRDKLGLKTPPELTKYAVRWAGSEELI